MWMKQWVGQFANNDERIEFLLRIEINDEDTTPLTHRMK